MNRSFRDILHEHWPEQAMTVSFKNPRDNEGFLFVLVDRYLLLVVSFLLVAIAPHYDVNAPSLRNQFHRPFGK